MVDSVIASGLFKRGEVALKWEMTDGFNVTRTPTVAQT